MIELANDVVIRCESCGEIIYRQRELYDPSESYYERSMGTECIAAIRDELECPNCGNTISFVLGASAYAYDIDNERPEITGGEFLIELGLRRLPHLGVAFGLGLFVLALGGLLAVGHGQVYPFRGGIISDVRTVDIDFRQVQYLAVLVLAGGHDAGDHIRHVHIVLNAGQVLALADLDICVAAHAPHDEHVEPVPLQLAAILLDDAITPQQAVHRVLVLEHHFLRRGSQVGIEGEVMFRQATGPDLIHDGLAGRRGKGFVLPDHVIEQIIEDVSGISRHLVQLRHHPVDAEGLIPQLAALDDRADSISVIRGIPDKSKGSGRHIPALPIRTHDFPECAGGLFQHDDLFALFVFAELLVLGGGG